MTDGQTLGILRFKLATRLGFATSGEIVVRQQAILDEFLNEAQDWLYWHIEDERWLKTVILKPGLGQALLDAPDDMEPRKPMSVWLRDPATCYNWVRLTKGRLFADELEEADTDQHTPFMRTTDAQLSGNPHTYRLIGQQIELAPATPKDSLDVRIDYTQALPRFTHDSDRALLDEHGLLLYALAQAKAHYQHSDAGTYGGLLDNYLKKLRAGSHTDQRYIRGRHAHSLPRR